MDARKFTELEERASAKAEFGDAVRRLEAGEHVRDVIEQMKQEGKALELSDEELRMLRSFRAFKVRTRKDGEVFKWQTRRPEGIQPAPERVFITDPQDVSG